MHYIKDIINFWDPIDLLSHAPEDEYQSEIEEIKALLSLTNDITVLSEGIFQIFVKSFGQEIFKKSKSECAQIAQLILSQKTLK